MADTSVEHEVTAFLISLDARRGVEPPFKECLSRAIALAGQLGHGDQYVRDLAGSLEVPPSVIDLWAAGESELVRLLEPTVLQGAARLLRRHLEDRHTTRQVCVWSDEGGRNG